MPTIQKKVKGRAKVIQKIVDRLYYLVICSRGPGSETIIVEDLKSEEDTGVISGKDTIDQKAMNAAVKKLKDAPVVEVDADVDEGPVIALTKKAKLSDIYKWLVKCTTSLKKQREQVHGAFISACLRAFMDIGEWTSCNEWRKVGSEAMSLDEFNQFMEATSQDIKALAKWDCKVLQTACKTYSFEERLARKKW